MSKTRKQEQKQFELPDVTSSSSSSDDDGDTSVNRKSPLFDPFDGKNFVRWSKIMRGLLDEKGLTYVVTYESFDDQVTKCPRASRSAAKTKQRVQRDNAKAYILIVANCTREMQDQVLANKDLDKSTTKALLTWTILRSVYDAYLPSRVSILSEKFATFCWKPNTTMTYHISRFKSMVSELRDLGREVGPAEEIGRFVSSLQNCPVHAALRQKLISERAKEINSYFETALLAETVPDQSSGAASAAARNFVFAAQAPAAPSQKKTNDRKKRGKKKDKGPRAQPAHDTSGVKQQQQQQRPTSQGAQQQPSNRGNNGSHGNKQQRPSGPQFSGYMSPYPSGAPGPMYFPYGPPYPSQVPHGWYHPPLSQSPQSWSAFSAPPSMCLPASHGSFHQQQQHVASQVQAPWRSQSAHAAAPDAFYPHEYRSDTPAHSEPSYGGGFFALTEASPSSLGPLLPADMQFHARGHSVDDVTVVDLKTDSAVLAQPHDASPSTIRFLVDSGASRHLSGRVELFRNVRPAPPVVFVTADKRARIASDRVGDIAVRAPNTGRVFWVHHVYLCPAAGSVSLLSVSTLVSRDVKVSFHDGMWDLRSADDAVHALVPAQNGVYPMDLALAEEDDDDPSNLRAFYGVAAASLPDTLRLWHLRLAHFNHRMVRSALKGVALTNDDPSVCAPCAQTKLADDPYPSREAPLATRYGERLHIDILEAGVVSIDQKRYSVNIVDEYSNEVLAVPTRSKAQISEVLQTHVSHLIARGVNVAFIRGGAELTNNGDIAAFCSRLGIRLEALVPYAHASNGRIERQNRVLWEAAMAMLNHASLSTSFWSYAVQYAAYIRNLLPSVSAKKPAAYTVIHGHAPDLRRIAPRIFGCKVFAFIPPEKRVKSGPRSVQGIFLGMCDNPIGYYVWTKPNNIVVVRTAVFDETGLYEKAPRASARHAPAPSSDSPPPSGRPRPDSSSSDAPSGGGSSSSGGAASSSGSAAPSPGGGSSASSHSPSSAQRMQPPADVLPPSSTSSSSGGGSSGGVSAPPVLPQTQQSLWDLDGRGPLPSPPLPVSDPSSEVASSGSASSGVAPPGVASSDGASSGVAPSGGGFRDSPAVAPVPSAPPAAPPPSSRGRPRDVAPVSASSPRARSLSPLRPPSPLPRRSSRAWKPSPAMLDHHAARPDRAPPPPRMRPTSAFVNHLTHDDLCACASAGCPSDFAGPVIVRMPAEQAMTYPRWQRAIEAELENFRRLNAWRLVPRAQVVAAGKQILPSRFVFTMKDPPAAVPEKARLVIGGHKEVKDPSKDFYSPVVDVGNIRLAVSIAQHLGLSVRAKIDFTSAFLNSTLEEEEEYYMELPSPLRSATLVARLNIWIYGLSGAPLAWNRLFTKALLAHGFCHLIRDPCLFFRRGSHTMVSPSYPSVGAPAASVAVPRSGASPAVPLITQLLLLHVDDCLIFCAPGPPGVPTLNDTLVEYLESLFKLNRLAPNHFLGMDLVDLPDGSLLLTQASAVERFLSSLGFGRVSFRTRPPEAPMLPADQSRIAPVTRRSGPASAAVLSAMSAESGDSLPTDGLLDSKSDPTSAGSFNLRSVVGTLNYLVTNTRLDIAYVTNFLARYGSRDNERVVVKRVLRYLSLNRSLGLVFPPARRDQPIQLEVYADADFASHPDGKSHSGYIAMVNGTPILWSSSKQTPVTLNTMQSEMVAACEATVAVEFIARVLQELGVPFQTPVLFEDNDATIANVRSIRVGKAIRHMNAKYFYTKYAVHQGCIKVKRVNTENQLADILTKPLHGPQFCRLRSRLLACPPS